MVSVRGAFTRRLAIIGAVGLVIRVAFVVYQRRQLPFPLSDATKYAGMANAIAQGRWFIDPLTGAESADHSPLYTLWLAPIGFLQDGHATEFQLMLWTVVLGVASVVVVGLAAREIAGDRVGLLAAGIAAVDPAMWVHDGLLLSESLAILCASALILCAYRLKHAPSLGRVLWLGLWCGLATLARSELALAVPLLLLPLTLLAPERTWKQRVSWLVAGAVLAGVVVAPWVLYNRSRFREPVMLSTNFGRTMAAAKCHEGYYGEYLGAQSYECLDRIEATLMKPGMDESERDRVYRDEAERFVREHPGRTVVEVAAAWGRIFGLYKPTQEIGYDFTLQTKGRIAAWLMVLAFYVLFPAAVVGGVLLRRRGVTIWPLLVFWLMILVSITLTFAQIRYRAVGEPTLVILAAVAADAFVTRFMAPRTEPAPVGADTPAAP